MPKLPPIYLRKKVVQKFVPVRRRLLPVENQDIPTAGPVTEETEFENTAFCILAVFAPVLVLFVVFGFI